MISDKFLWGNVFFGGKLQIDAKNSNFEFFESALYLKSVSMPLMRKVSKTSNCIHTTFKWYMGHPLISLIRDGILVCLHVIDPLFFLWMHKFQLKITFNQVS